LLHNPFKYWVHVKYCSIMKSRLTLSSV
jgi:hypothetical protein